MKLWKNFAFAIVLIALAVSCKSYRQAPEDTIKVLAVTSEGDTIQLDVNSLRPRVYQTIYHAYPYYYNYWRPSPFYFGSNYYYQGSVIRPNYRPNNSNSVQSGSGGEYSGLSIVCIPLKNLSKSGSSPLLLTTLSSPF